MGSEGSEGSEGILPGGTALQTHGRATRQMD